MAEVIIEQDRTWICGNERESIPGSRETVSKGSEKDKPEEAPRTALLESGQRPGMGGKRAGVNLEQQLEVRFQTLSPTLPSFVVFFSFFPSFLSLSFAAFLPSPLLLGLHCSIHPK